jgi:hypothetical protein
MTRPPTSTLRVREPAVLRIDSDEPTSTIHVPATASVGPESMRQVNPFDCGNRLAICRAII